MGSLGDRDASSRAAADLSDLAASPADDASNHIRGNADVLSLNLLTIFRDERVSTGASVGVGPSAIATVVAEVGTIASAVVLTAGVTITTIATTTDWVAVAQRRRAQGRTDRGVVEHSAGAALPVINEALSDFPDGLLDAFRCALDFDDSLRRLRKHLLLCDHAHPGSILDVLDFQTLSSDDGAHLVVRDQESDGFSRLAHFIQYIQALAARI